MIRNLPSGANPIARRSDVDSLTDSARQGELKQNVHRTTRGTFIPIRVPLKASTSSFPGYVWMPVESGEIGKVTVTGDPAAYVKINIYNRTAEYADTRPDNWPAGVTYREVARNSEIVIDRWG